MSYAPYPISNLEMKAAAQSLPAAPEIFVKLGRLLKEPDTEMNDVTGLVAKDSTLVTKVLRLSNTAFFNTGEPMSSLEEAINRIGFQELYRIVGMAATSNVFTVWNVAYRVDGEQVWRNSLALGLAMEQLARCNGEDVGEAYSVGILRPLGKQIIDTCAKNYAPPPTFDPEAGIALLEWELDTFGTTNAASAAYLLESWGFAEPITVGLRFQYEPDYANRNDYFARMLNIAGHIAERAGAGLPGETAYWDLSPDCIKEANVTLNQIKSATGYVKERLESLVKALAL